MLVSPVCEPPWACHDQSARTLAAVARRADHRRCVFGSGGGYLVIAAHAGVPAISGTLPGAERLGVWVTITSTVVFLNLLDLGIASTLTNLVARAFAWGDQQYAARSTTHALVMTAAIALGFGVLFAAVGSRIDWMALFNVAADVPRDEVNHTVAAAVARMLPWTAGGRWEPNFPRISGSPSQ